MKNNEIDDFVNSIYGSLEKYDWSRVRLALDNLGKTIHRVEDPEHRKYFYALVRVIQQYEDAHSNDGK
jgi:KaiC/GvpD/RAD55 family RecA-like ATPase